MYSEERNSVDILHPKLGLDNSEFILYHFILKKWAMIVK